MNNRHMFLIVMAGLTSLGSGALAAPAPVKLEVRKGVLVDAADLAAGVTGPCLEATCPGVLNLHLLPTEVVPEIDSLSGEFDLKIRPVSAPGGYGLSHINFDFRLVSQVSERVLSEVRMKYPNAVFHYPSARMSRFRTLDDDAGTGLKVYTLSSRIPGTSEETLYLHHAGVPQLLRLRVESSFLRQSACLVNFFRNLKKETARHAQSSPGETDPYFNRLDELSLLTGELQQGYEVTALPTRPGDHGYSWSVKVNLDVADVSGEKMSDRLFETLMRYGRGSCSCRDIMASQDWWILARQLSALGKSCRDLL